MRTHFFCCIAALCILSVSVQGQNNGAGLHGQYFLTRDLTGAAALERIDPGLDFQWGQASPGAAIPADKFSVRWSGQIEAPATGVFTIATVSDDGVRLWLDGKLLIDDWYSHGALRNQTLPLSLTAGKRYNLRIEYYENTGNSSIKLLWSYPGQAEQLIPKTRLYPAPVAFTAPPPPGGRTMLSELPFLAQSNGLGPVERNRANGGAADDDGRTISIGGYKWGSGLGMHAPGAVTIALDDRFDVFRAIAGVDDEVGDAGSVVFEVWVDGVKKYSSPLMKGSMPPLAIEVPVENARQLRLVVTPGSDGNKGDSASWAYARLEGKETVRYLSDMKWLSAANGLGPVERDNANGGAGENDGEKIRLRGEVYKKGLGVMPLSKIVYDLDGRYELFSAVIGIDDAAQRKGSAVFEAWSGMKLLYRSPALKGTDSPRHVVIPVKGVDELTLKVLDGGDGSAGDLADWADAKLLPMGSDIPAGVMPSPPASLTALGGDGLVKLTWKASANTVSYTVWRSTEPNDATPQTIATNLMTTSYMDDGARNGVKYYYRVIGVNPNGKGAPSNEASATPMAPLPAPPPPPTNLTAKPGNAQVTLAWQASQGAASYTLFRGLSSTTLAAVASNLKGSTYIDTKLANGTTYFYQVVAVNAGGSSKPSNQVSAKPVAPELPPAPPGLTATGGTGQITLNWTGVSSAQSYNVYRGTSSNGQGATPIASGVKATTFLDKGLTNGTRYYYKVASVNANGTGPMSAEASATPMMPPSAPAGLTAAGGNRQITLTWGAVNGATSYNVYRGTTANGQAATPIATGLTSPGYVNTGLTNGTTYFYKVTAVGPGGESARSNEASATPQGPPPTQDPATISALRFLRQATWGPKPGDVDRVKQIGRDAFLEEQFNAMVSTYPDSLYDQSVEYMQEHFMRLTLTGNDQLRQRVAFALHQIWVVSAVEVDCNEAMVNYYRVLINNAFGNYRTLMTEMTLNPAMGVYLNMANNRSQAVTGAPPNENYAREILQLFTAGLVKLNPDGSQQMASGLPVPSYTEEDVKELARIFTGWTFGDGNPSTVPTKLAPEEYRFPMEPVEAFHDRGAKTFLGVNFPANRNAREELEAALDVIFAQPSVAPFVSRQLIQHLVTSNPSPQYIADVAAVFNNNGSNVKGDLRAVISAILRHPEAALGAPSAGKLMEPALFIISQLRTLNANVTDHPFMSDLAAEMGQRVLYSPSVFNYFSPFFRVRGATLFGPEFQIFTSVTTLARTNFVARLLSGGFGGDVTIDYTPFRNLAGDPAALVDYVNTLFMGGLMSNEHRQAIIDAVSATPASNTTERARTALYLTLVSAQYQVEH